MSSHDALVDCRDEGGVEGNATPPRPRRTPFVAGVLAVAGLAAAGVALLTQGDARPTGAGPAPAADLDGVTQLHTSHFCRTYPYMSFFHKDPVTHNNLAGKGPGFHTREGMTYRTRALGKGAGKEFAKEVDVRIHATSTNYQPFSSRLNGMQGEYGSINLNSGSSVSAAVTFVDAATEKQLTMPDLAFTFFDLDTGNAHTSVEYVTLKGFSKYKLTDATEVKVTKLSNGFTKFQASTVGNGDDNPTDPMALTDQQKNRAVTALFENVSRIDFEIGASAGDGPRFFTWVARPSLYCAVTLQKGWRPPLHDLEAIPPMEVAIEAQDHEHFISYSARKGDQVRKGQGVAVTQIPNQPPHTYTSPITGTVVAIQDGLKPNDNLDHRLHEKFIMVIRYPELSPLEHGGGVVGAGPGTQAMDHPAAVFVKYWVEVGDNVQEGRPIVLAKTHDGTLLNYTSSASGTVKARQESLEPGNPLAMVKDRQLVTLGPFVALRTSSHTSKTAVVPEGEGMTFARYDAKVGDVVKHGTKIATVLDAEGKEVPILASVGGIVSARQNIATGTKISRVEDRNLATVGKFPPLACSPQETRTEFGQASEPLKLPFEGADAMHDDGTPKSTPPPVSDMSTIEFEKYHVKPGDMVQTGDKVATIKDDAGVMHDILAPQPGIVNRIQEHLKPGMYLSKVMEDENLATIGRLPALQVSRSEEGSFAPRTGNYKFKEWKVKVGDTVKKGDPVAVLEHSSVSVDKIVTASKSGCVDQRLEELQVGDNVEESTEDEDIVTIGRFRDPPVGFMEKAVQADMDDIFVKWEVDPGDSVHFGDPIAQIRRESKDADGRRLSASLITIPSPGTGTVDFEEALEPGKSIRDQAVGPTIAKVSLPLPWWLCLLAALMGLCCCFCCVYKVMEKPKPVYKPMPPVEEPEPPKPEPPAPPAPEPKPDGLRLDFSDNGRIHTVYAKYRPLGIKHNFVAPIIAHDFTINSYAKQELGVKDGWKLTRVDEEELNDTTNFEHVNKKLHDHMKDFPLWPLPLEFRTDDYGRKRLEKFVERPIGLEFANEAPIRVGHIYETSPAERQGIQVGWVLTKIGERDVHENHDFREVMAVFKEGVEPLDDFGKKYT